MATQHYPSTSRPARCPGRRAFTLMEMMVVVAIIVILAGILVAVGTQVKRKAQYDATKATLVVLRTAMSDFMKNNAEPGAGTMAANTPLATSNLWLPALKSDPNIAANLNRIPGYTSSSSDVLDAFGGRIYYVPSNPNVTPPTPGYFVSMGPDGQLGTLGKTVTPPDPAADNIFSDPVGP